MQLHTYVESRLVRWAYWVQMGARPGPQRVVSWWGPCILDRNVAQPMRRTLKIDPTETEETELAVRALAVELRDAIIEMWTMGGTSDEKAKRLRCDRVTLWRRVNRANAKLLGYFNDQAAGIPLPEPEPVKNKLTVRNRISIFPATVA